MSKSALEEWNDLNRAVNCKHYIGAKRHQVITEALEKSQPEKKVAPKRPTPIGASAPKK